MKAEHGTCACGARATTPCGVCPGVWCCSWRCFEKHEQGPAKELHREARLKERPPKTAKEAK